MAKKGCYGLRKQPLQPEQPQAELDDSVKAYQRTHMLILAFLLCIRQSGS